MTSIRMLAIAALVSAAGCTGDDQCYSYDYANTRPIAPAYQLRDPVTGTCQDFSWGGDCGDPCAPCPLAGAEIAQPDWAQCYGQCEGLNEATCTNTSGCRAIYNGSTFYECWGVAPSGPIESISCTGLDAQECSRHDNCVAFHAPGTPIGSFMSCGPERMPQDPGSCVGEVTCNSLPPQCPAGTIAGRRNGCWTGYCIPYADCDQLPACDTLGEVECIGRTDCAPTYVGQNCTCTMSGCTCQSWLFDACKVI